MSRLISTLMIVFLLLSLAAAPVFASEASEVSEELDGMLSSIIESGRVKGAVLSVVQDGQIQHCEGYGFADEYHNITASGDKTAFRIGSVSKTLVAAAVQILAQEGRLDMDCDIADYLKTDLPLKYPVTMRQLLTHTAGFEETITGMAVFNVSDTEPLSESIAKYRPAQIHEPGTVISYSNYSIALAAYVAETIAGQDFAQYCRERIFVPLGMMRTTFEHMHDTAYVSKPYLPDGTETLEPYMNLYPEGSAVSTAEDMAKYIKWLLDREDTRVLTQKSKDELFFRHFSMAEELPGIGLIWNRKTRNGKLYYGKKGETLHFYTRIALYPQQNTGIFLSFNTYLPEHEINEIMEKATEVLYGKAGISNPDPADASMDISGTYTNNWSSFKTPEKILRYMVPGKMISITKSLDDSFLLDGARISLIGEDLYSTPVGTLKFRKQDNRVIAAGSSVTYTKVPFWEHSSIQIIVPLLFIVFTVANLARELILRFRKKRGGYSAFYLTGSLVQFICVLALIFLMLEGIAAYKLLAFEIPLKICGWLITSACAAQVIHTLSIWRRRSAVRFLPACWSIAGILFSSWMVWLNIL